MLTFDHSDATAFSRRDQRYLFLINTNWNDPADDAVNIDWTRDLFSKLLPFGPDASYVNYLSDEGIGRIRVTYGEATYRRLTEVKAQYDPDNLFHHNQNIQPGGDEVAALSSKD